MIGKLGLFVALFIVLGDKVQMINNSVRACSCTRSRPADTESNRECNLGLERALGNKKITKCTGGYHHRLNDKDEIIAESKCPCTYSVLDWLSATHCGIKCLTDNRCLYLALSVIGTFVFFMVSLTLPIATGRYFVCAFSMIWMNTDGTLEIRVPWITWAAVFFAFVGEWPIATIARFGQALTRLPGDVSPTETLAGIRATNSGTRTSTTSGSFTTRRDGRGRYSRKSSLI